MKKVKMVETTYRFTIEVVSRVNAEGYDGDAEEAELQSAIDEQISNIDLPYYQECSGVEATEREEDYYDDEGEW